MAPRAIRAEGMNEGGPGEARIIRRALSGPGKTSTWLAKFRYSGVLRHNFTNSRRATMKSRIFAALVAAAALPVAAQTAGTPGVDSQDRNNVQKVESKAAGGGKAAPKDCAGLQKARNDKKIAKKKSNRKTAA
jgi:hypothetical protein